MRPCMHDGDREAPVIEAGYAPQPMATRSIVTSQPDVTCDVCQRRLLRGEQPEVFLAAGEPRTVCELCAPRAAHEGWLRETDSRPVSVPPLRPRRGRNLFGRLRQAAARPVASAAPAPTPSLSYDRESEPYDFLTGPTVVGEGSVLPPAQTGSESLGGPRSGAVAAVRPGARPALAGAEDPEIEESIAQGDGLLQSALEGFNASEYPRRIAGVARSLGAPTVTIRPVEYLGRAVTIVVAWELCWYRYGVDLDNDAPETRLLGQGTELTELAREDRHANALADEAGALSLSGH
jgi:hypothetical protein